MREHKITLAVFPGTFDPITNGHLDVIRRGAALFDELVVAVGENPEKRSLLPMAKRVEVVRQVVADLPNVRVEGYTGLTVDLARRVGARLLLRGVRGSADLHFEAQVAHANRQVTGIETVFILPDPGHAFVSSRLVRQIASEGGDVSGMVPPEVLPHLTVRAQRGE
jgi:pantetheine-phosphate adenylyltransferase